MIESPKIASNDKLVRKFKLFYELFAFSSNYPGVKRQPIQIICTFQRDFERVVVNKFGVRINDQIYVVHNRFPNSS